MANINEEARIPVYINDEQAQSALKNLTNEAEKWRKKMYEAMSGGDMKGIKEAERELGKVNRQMTDIKREAFDVNKVLSNLSTASTKDLRKALQTVNKEMEGLNRGTKEYNSLAQKKSAIRNEFNLINSSITQQTGLLGRLGASFNNLPGPIGNAVSGIGALGKSMWALVANPIGATIAAIVASLTLLYKAFTSTDTGAVAMEGTLKAIGNVMDVLVDRAMSYYKMLWSLVTFDWQGVKTNATAAFGGIGSAIKDAAGAGWNYAKAMDDIADREAAAQIRMAKMKVDIETLKNLSKDSNKTAREKYDLAKQAMDKEIELNGLEKQFMKERNAVETMNLASKIQNNKLTMTQKEAQLKQWLEVDDKELQSLTEKDAAFAEFVNKNEAAFQDLQKKKSEEFDKDAAFQTETRRLQKSLSSEKKALMDEEKEATIAAEGKKMDAIDLAYKQNLLLLKQKYEGEETLQKEYRARMLASEIAYLKIKEQLETDPGKNIDLQSQIIDKQTEYTAALKEAVPEILKTRDGIDALNGRLLEESKLLGYAAKKQSDGTVAQEEATAKQKQQAETIQMVGNVMTDYITGAISGSLDQYQTFGDTLVLMSLQMLKQMVPIWSAQILGLSLASPESVATWGAAGLAKYAAITTIMYAGIAAVEAGVKSGINKKREAASGSKSGYYEGGFTG
jgi:hypothetical protein